MTNDELPPIYVTPLRLCPACGESLDRVFAANEYTQEHPDAVPQPGDFSICRYCAAALQFTETLALVELTQAQVDALEEADRQEMWRLQRRARRLRLPKGDTDVPQ